jgi:hypothetical protein
VHFQLLFRKVFDLFFSVLIICGSAIGVPGFSDLISSIGLVFLSSAYSWGFSVVISISSSGTINSSIVHSLKFPISYQLVKLPHSNGQLL